MNLRGNAIEAECAENLRRIMTVPGMGIVISSAWRAPPIERLLTVWRDAGLNPSWIIGVTPDLALRPRSTPDRLRGMEIQSWLVTNAAKSARYAVIDDQQDEIDPCFPMTAVFATNPEIGLTRQVAADVVHCLTKTP